MESTLNESASETWLQIAPLLDGAVEALGETDRRAIVLRFYEGCSLNEVGAALGATEAAAEKRVSRSLEKLRKMFTKRGVTLTATAIAVAVSANSVQAAPVGLAATVIATAAKGTGIPAGITILVKGALKLMAWTKAKTVVVVTAGFLLAAGTATVAISSVTHGGREARQILERTLAKYAALQSYRSSGTTVEEIHDAALKTIHGTFTMQLDRPDLYRVDYEQVGASLTNKASLWSDGSGHYFDNHMSIGQGPVKMMSLQQNLGDISDVSSGVTAIVPSLFYGVEIPTLSSYVWSTISTVQGWLKSHPVREPDETVDGIDCFVLSITTDEGKAWMWIGKQDGLVHQSRQRNNSKLTDITEAQVMKFLKETPGKPSLSVKEFQKRINAAQKKATETGKPVKINFKILPGQTGLESITIQPPGFRVRTQTHRNIVAVEAGSPPPVATGEHKQEILIKSVFVTTPNKEVGNIVRELAKPAPPLDPTSATFRNILEKYSGVKIISAPSISTAVGMQAIASMTDSVKVHGTNANVGQSLDVTSNVQADGKIVLRVVAEYSELVEGTTPGIRITRAMETMLPFNSGETVLIRNQVGSPGTKLPPIPGSPAKSLLVFVNASLVGADGR